MSVPVCYGSVLPYLASSRDGWSPILPRGNFDVKHHEGTADTTRDVVEGCELPVALSGIMQRV